MQCHLTPDPSRPVAPGSQLLATKLYIPVLRPHLVSRRRLLERLDAAYAARLVLVSAPAGAGKTTLLSEWLSGCGCRPCWVSLDEADNDVVRFFSYVMAAVEGAVPGSGEPWRWLLGRADAPPRHGHPRCARLPVPRARRRRGDGQPALRVERPGSGHGPGHRGHG